MNIRLTLWPEADSPLYIHNQNTRQHTGHHIMACLPIIIYVPYICALDEHEYTPDPLAGGGFPIIYTQSKHIQHNGHHIMTCLPIIIYVPYAPLLNMNIRLTLWPEADSPLYIHNQSPDNILVITS
jgi:hypothetical protein